MHEQAHDTEYSLDVQQLLNDLQYIDIQIRAIKSDLQYVMRLIEAVTQEHARINLKAEGVLCPL